jgi:membrane protein implicated in regulation of membrane protease activity
MEPWVFWIVLAVVLAVGEIFSLSLYLAPFAGGALAAALVGAVGGGVAISLAVFLVASSVLLLGLRPIARAHMRTGLSMKTGTAALVGRDATTLERVASDAGMVKLDGETWTARPFDDDEVIEAGRRVTVMEIRGATALVSE